MVGIDFGTTTTEVAVTIEGSTHVLSDPTGREVTPSVVSFPPNGATLIGSAAAERRIIDPVNTLHSVKRIVGRVWFDQEVVEFRKNYPFRMEEGADRSPRFVTRGGKLTAEDAVRMQLAWVREYAQLPLDAPVTITAPPAFGPEQRLAITEAAMEAGHPRVGIVDEPYAAALPYLSSGGPEELLAVYDLGGGTFDFAVLRVRGLHHFVLGTAGDANIGGDDLDRALAEWAVQAVLERHQWDLRAREDSFQNLITACQRAKVELSSRSETRVALGLVDPVLQGKDLIISQQQLANAIHELVQATFACCDEALRDAGISAERMGRVILAGGSTQLPSIRRAVSLYFGREPTADLPPDRIVAMGASMAAAARA